MELLEPALIPQRPKYSSSFAPVRLVSVTTWHYENVYKYDRRLLWKTYGLSVASATLAVIGGMVALLLKGASYSDDFSTVFRISQAARISVNLEERDELGHAPLPKRLKNVTVEWHQATTAGCLVGKEESGTSTKESKSPAT